MGTPKKYFIPVIFWLVWFLWHYFFMFKKIQEVFWNEQYIFFYFWLFGCIMALYYFIRYRENNLSFLGFFFSAITVLCSSVNIFIQPYDFSPSVMTFESFIFNSLLFSTFFIFAEKLYPQKKQFSLRSWWFLDILYFLINRFSISFIVVIISMLIHTFFGFLVYLPFQEFIKNMPIFIQLVVIFLIADFIYYWAHRSYHEVPLLWKIHTLHHSPEQMDWLAGTRIHLVEFWLTRIVITLPLILFWFSEFSINIYAFIVGAQSALIHSNIRIPKSFLDDILVMPRFHHWHHAKSGEAFYTNYASMFVFFDTIFSTALKKENYPEIYGTFLWKRFPTDIFRQLAFPLYSKFALKIHNQNFISKWLDYCEHFMNDTKEKVHDFVELEKEASKEILLRVKTKAVNTIHTKRAKLLLAKKKKKCEKWYKKSLQITF